MLSVGAAEDVPGAWLGASIWSCVIQVQEQVNLQA